MRSSANQAVRELLITSSLVAAIALAAGCGGGGGGGPEPTPVPTATPAPSRGPAGAGTVSEITDVSIASDPAGRVQVTFLLTDAAGIPLTPTLAATESDQQARVRMTIAQLQEYSGGGGGLANTFLRYVNQINETRPAYDRNGTLETLDAAEGLYRYTFATTLANVDRDATYTVGMQVDREFEGQEESANPVFDVVPAGGEPTVWADVTTAQCNTCHNPLILHGNRREVRLCTTCHTEAAVDEKGRSVDFRHMIHKIHAGKELPSVAEGPPGSVYEIYSSFARQEVVFAEKLADEEVIGVGFPQSLRECLKCHAEGPTSEYYRTKPSAAACATCHDNVNPSQQTTEAGPPGTNHAAGGFADGQCNACHRAEQNQEFDISVPGAHVVPEQSTQLAGLNVSLESVADTGAGQTPAITFTVKDNAGEPLRDLSGLNRLAFTLAGPTTPDYQELIVATAVGGGASGTLTGPDAGGAFRYVPAAPIPPTATGTWTVGAEARRPVQLTESITVNEASPNPLLSFSVDGSDTVLRRVVVDQEDCGVCHGQFSKGFSIHGNLRNRTQYCVLCHNPDNSDASRRRNDPEAVAAASPNATIDFKVLIHKMHRGEDLAQQPYIVYGFGPTPPGYTKHDFGELRFPGDLRDCLTCHAEGTYLMPPYPGGALGSLVTHLNPADGSTVVDGRLGPIRSVCTACHDSDAALAHVDAETSSSGVESCTVCHGEGREFAISVVHAGRN